MIAVKSEVDNCSKEDKNNLLCNAPHTIKMISSKNWDFPYTRNEAVFPLPFVQENKFWPSVRRVDDAFGDRNLICTCAPIESYIES